MKKARGPTIETVWDHIAWSYANLARADAALSEGCSKYKRHHHIIRSKLFSGLRTGKMSMRSLYDDERLKMTLPQACFYCGSTESLSLDHLIPRFRGGEDEGDNLVWACRRCNSSKGSADLLQWMERKDSFPPLFLLRRYLKLVTRYCQRHDILTLTVAEAAATEMPFELHLLPHRFPELESLEHWIRADRAARDDVNSTVD